MKSGEISSLVGKLDYKKSFSVSLQSSGTLKGTLHNSEELDGQITHTEKLSGKLSNDGALSGKLSHYIGDRAPYTGPYEFTPTREKQSIEMTGQYATKDIVINPIPSNYGLIEWDGSVLTVS